MSETTIAVWGMISLVAAFAAACLWLVCAIWGAQLAGKICGTVLIVAVFSIAAALFAQSVVDRRVAADHAQHNPLTE